MIPYFDTSALAKWYVHEPFSDEIERFISEVGTIAISRLTFVELRSLVSRRRREKLLDHATEARIMSTFDEDLHLGCFAVSSFDDAMFLSARKMIDELSGIPLRTLDSLHIVIAQESKCKSFATADKVQAKAAKALGLTVHTFY